MKEIGTTHWTTPNTGATNFSGFTGLPGGVRFADGTFDFIADLGYWWSSTESSTTSAWYRTMYYGSDDLSSGSIDKLFGLSVRCLRN